MELCQLIADLSSPAAYLHSADSVKVCQTHISVVFLAGSYAYKIKKPVDLGFVDYSTLARRRHFCEREVALNRRLAPSVYLGVVPITCDGAIAKLDGEGEPIEWAVKMTRLPDEALLGERLDREQVDLSQVEGLARRIATFHAQAESGPHIAAGGSIDVVAGNARENFEQSEAHVGATLCRAVFDRLRLLTEDAQGRHREVIEGRAARGVPRDTHGDLRLGHVYQFPDRAPPDDLVIVDCIEFNDRYRHADPIADMAFLVMDFARHGRRDLGRSFADAYFQASGDEEGRTLLPFYTAYRAAVKGKVEGFKHAESEVPAADRTLALEKARACWLLALGELEVPERRPCLVLVGGLPGTGKSTMSHALADRGDFVVIRSDVVRKELAGFAAVDRAGAAYGEGIYSPEWNERTYAECARRAEAVLFEGKRVLVDANFVREADRRRLLDSAVHRGVPCALLVCRADPAIVRARLKKRRDDASDADWSIYLEASSRWEAPGSGTLRSMWEIETSDTQEAATSHALGVLRDLGLKG